MVSGKRNSNSPLSTAGRLPGLEDLLGEIKSSLSDLRSNPEEIVVRVDHVLGKIEKLENIFLTQYSLVKQALDSSPWGILCTDEHGLVNYVNQWLLQISGYTQDQLLGLSRQKLRETLYPKEPDTFLDASYAGQIVYEQRVLAKSKTGEDLPMEVTSVPIRNPGRVQGVIVHCRDVRREEQLLLFKKQASFLFETLQVGILIVDARAICRYANESYAQMIGFPRELIMNRHVNDFVNKAFQKISPILSLETLNTGRSYKDHLVDVVLNDGRQRLYSINSSPIKESQGSLMGALLIIRDITEEKA
ncbi:MAG: PAS domain-containing protein [Bacillota bacterium]